MRLFSASPSNTLNFGKSNFTLDEVQECTSGFSRDNVLGEGGFGRVYRGELPNGDEVAVKRLEVGGGQGEREFLTEVEIISRVHHKHVVSLVGFCTTGSERILVFEYVPNGSLKSHLRGQFGFSVPFYAARFYNAPSFFISLISASGLAFRVM